MSLYTFATKDELPFLKPIAGLHIEECTDITLLARVGEVPESEVLRRLANDNLAYVAFIHGAPAAFGWMARGRARLGELNHEFILPLYNRYLWNFRTMLPFRGLGIYPALLQFMINAEWDKAERFWIIHAPENLSSLHGIRKAGFQYVGKLYSTQSGALGFEADMLPADISEATGAMGFTATTQPTASCWNCSSPYLNKKNPSCCCSDRGEVCQVV
jgi:hypothetical protein